MDEPMIPIELRLALVILIGACLGTLVNWAIYALAWHPRPVSPWSRVPPDAPRRRAAHRIPVIGWLLLRQEADLHGPGFWIRPLLLELGLGVALAVLYWWEVERMALLQGQLGVPPAPPLATLHLQFVAHVLLLCWMLAASFIDIDEKIIPDDITVSGTLLGLVLATLVPMSLLPHVAVRPMPPVVGTLLHNAGGMPIPGPNGQPIYLEPTTAVAPTAWPPTWGGPRQWQSLAVALACYWLWCFALAPRVWRGRRGAAFALRLITARVRRELCRPPLIWLLLAGTAAIVCVWTVGQAAWAGLLTALVGLVASGGIVWAVRLMGTAALRREAMGFGDVTLMMMVGTFLGWQACLIAFFLAPFAALLIGIAQFVLRRDDVIPYGPFLCLASAAVVVAWAPIWLWAQGLFAAGALVPAVLVVCLVLLGVMLAIWQMIKTALFGGRDTNTRRELYFTTEGTRDTEEEQKN
jgi:prepilin signal peptidase PulO-like enzyme (type II secretory pathway)